MAIAALAVTRVVRPAGPQKPPVSSDPPPTWSAWTSSCATRTATVVRGLKADDFVVFEDGKPQQITSFDFEEIATDAMPSAAPAPAVLGLEQLQKAAAQRAVVRPLRRGRLGRRPGGGAGAAAAGWRARGGGLATGPARPAHGRAALRHELDAAGRDRSRREVGQQLRREADDARRPRRGRLGRPDADDPARVHGRPRRAEEPRWARST